MNSEVDPATWFRDTGEYFDKCQLTIMGMSIFEEVRYKCYKPRLRVSVNY